MTAAPFGPQAVARVVMETSASRLTLSRGGEEEHLVRAGFEGGAPDIRAEDGVVTVRYRRPRLDVRSRHARIALNPAIPWTVEVQGGVTDLVAELRDVPLAGLSVAGGVNHLHLELPPPSGTVRLAIDGGTSDAIVERPRRHRHGAAGSGRHLAADLRRRAPRERQQGAPHAVAPVRSRRRSV